MEVLVAISIFALIGLGTNQVLRTIIDTRDITESRTAQFIKLQRALVVIERDLIQLSNRTIRDELGDPLDAILIGSDRYNLEFSRLGWRNPTAAPRSNLQRVAYQLLDGELLRHYWLVLDRAEDSEPMTQKVLTDVENFRITALTAEGETTDLWPMDEDNRGQVLPAALEIFIGIDQIGEIRKVVNLVAVAKLSSGEADDSDGNGEQDDADEQQDKIVDKRRDRRRRDDDEDDDYDE